ncbi:hypothetical protein [Butyrivibrio sp.]|uniref:hypothetical protein n=1 Tax=Butyrivibrio sp. TaxID=28121 RepID=UPI0025C568D5|nr:hypothetical protein [Butyrivibrio sp.]MBQ7431365.1 hypothetical protein [Butyrivibrio sp.]MBQ9302695.1 hypothetical protein [Butyrivibrio sp.]
MDDKAIQRAKIYSLNGQLSTEILTQTVMEAAEAATNEQEWQQLIAGLQVRYQQNLGSIEDEPFLMTRITKKVQEIQKAFTQLQQYTQHPDHNSYAEITYMLYVAEMLENETPALLSTHRFNTNDPRCHFYKNWYYETDFKLFCETFAHDYLYTNYQIMDNESLYYWLNSMYGCISMGLTLYHKCFLT